jgi:hypothetical protein
MRSQAERQTDVEQRIAATSLQNRGFAFVSSLGKVRDALGRLCRLANGPKPHNDLHLDEIFIEAESQLDLIRDQMDVARKCFDEAWGPSQATTTQVEP